MKKQKIYGKIGNNFTFGFVPVVSNEIKTKHEFVIGVSIYDFKPLVRYKNKTFVLGWRDIVELAEAAGLFNEEKEQDNENLRR